MAQPIRYPHHRPIPGEAFDIQHSTGWYGPLYLVSSLQQDHVLRDKFDSFDAIVYFDTRRGAVTWDKAACPTRTHNHKENN